MLTSPIKTDLGCSLRERPVTGAQSDKRGIYAVIPALNEKGTIGQIVSSVMCYAGSVVVVDDGSTDGTAELASAAGAHTIVHSINRGYDVSIDDGFRYVARQNDAKIVFTFDADGQHRPETIPALLEPLLDDNADIVVGTRPRKARIAEKLLGLYTELRYGIVDPLCGLKGYKIGVFQDIGFFDRINSIGTELMLRAIRKGYRVVQMPISVGPRADHSRFGQSIRGNYRIFLAFLRIVFFL
jgi:hypothetical protein